MRSRRIALLREVEGWDKDDDEEPTGEVTAPKVAFGVDDIEVPLGTD